MSENIFGCDSVEDVVIPEGGSNNFFKPEDGKNKIRFLAGPKKYYVSQAWENNKPVGDKKFYDFLDKEATKDPNAKIAFAYIIYDYKEKAIKTWDIHTKGILKQLQAINELNPDLSAFDCGLTKKKGSNGFMDYTLINGAPKAFTDKDVIKDFKENNPLKKMSEAIDKKIEESKGIEELEGDEEFNKVFDSEPKEQTKAREKAQDDDFLD